MTLQGIPDIYNILTDCGWQSIKEISIDSILFTMYYREKRVIEYQKPRIVSLFPYTGIITEFSLLHTSVEDLSNNHQSTFQLKSFDPAFKTLIKRHQILSIDKIEWNGNLTNFVFNQPVSIAISNSDEYFFLEL